jgi:hypothetical protein
MNADIITTLKDDNEYYNGVGRNYLSNSDIGVLLRNPKMFGIQSEKTLPMLQGNYFHTACLEPHKLKDFPLVDASTRTTNLYKDACKDRGLDFMLLSKEAEEVDYMVKALRENRELSNLVWDNGCKYEVPTIGEIMNLPFKGKADIINGDMIYDLKTTSSSLDDFKHSAKRYNYDSQAAIYQQLFGKNMAFIVIEKGTNRLGFFKCSDEFIETGWTKVSKAVEVYNNYFGINSYLDVSQYYINSYLF